MPQTVIKNVTVVPMRQEGVLPSQDVFIREGLVAEIVPTGSRTYDAGSQVLPGDGQFLMPGLFDMHTHASHLPNFPQLELLHGVTTVRDTACVPKLFHWRSENPPGIAMVPEVYAPGPVLEGEKQYHKDKKYSVVVVGKDQAEAIVAAHQAMGADLIKVYNTLTKEDYLHAARFARSRGLKVAGHPHQELTIDELAEVLDSVEHADHVIRAYSDKSNTPDKRLTAEMVSALTKHKTAFCPTLILAKQYYRRVEDGITELERELAPELKYMPQRRLNEWRLDPRKTSQEIFHRSAELTERLHRAGVRILLGTDSANAYVLPGHSTIQELGLLVTSARLTPYEALRTGTVDAAEFLGVNAGTVEPGQKANLVLVSGNPLADIKFLEKPTDVFVRGKHFTRETLEGSLEEPV